jgi:hypothetical protein
LQEAVSSERVKGLNFAPVKPGASVFFEKSNSTKFMHPEQKRIYKSMTPDQKFAIANGLYWAARRAREAWLRSLHPDWTEEQISRTVRDIFLHAGT